MEYLIPTVATEGWTEECLVVIGILSLVLHHHSANGGVLVEASKTILLSTPLTSTVNNTMRIACSKGPALVDLDEGSNTGETLICLLLFHLFTLKRSVVLSINSIEYIYIHTH